MFVCGERLQLLGPEGRCSLRRAEVDLVPVRCCSPRCIHLYLHGGEMLSLMGLVNLVDHIGMLNRSNCGVTYHCSKRVLSGAKGVAI